MSFWSLFGWYVVGMIVALIVLLAIFNGGSPREKRDQYIRTRMRDA